MKTDTLIVVGSLFFGWLLNEISQEIRYRRENRKSLNESIFHLMNLKLKLEEMIPIWDGIRNRCGLNNYEKELVLSLLENEEITSIEYFEKTEKTILDLAKVDPYLSLNLKCMYEIINDNDAKKVLDSPVDSFQKMIEIKKRTIEIAIKSISINLKRLMLRKSPLLYLRMMYCDRKNISYDYSYLFNRS
jgi:hypothetical protein